MWLRSKSGNLLIWLLLLLFAMGFMRQSSLILAVVFAIIFFNNNMKIPTVASFDFSLLVCFAAMYFAFATQSGLLKGLIALCCPLAFYIGHSMRGRRSQNAKNILLLLAVGMLMHIVLNMVYEFVHYGFSFSSTWRHYDIWSREYTAATGAMTNGTLIAGCMYYLLLWKENAWVRWGAIVMFVLALVYNLTLGGRTFYVEVAIGMVVGMGAHIYAGRGADSIAAKGKSLIVILCAVLLIGLFFSIRYAEQIEEFVNNSYFYHRFFRESGNDSFFESSRWTIRLEYLEKMWKYPWGGRKLFREIQQYAHELWMDIYDVAGVIPYMLIILYTFRSLVRALRLIRDWHVPTGIRVLFAGYIACVMTQFMIEPTLSVSSILVASYCMIDGVLCSNEYSGGWA